LENFLNATTSSFVAKFTALEVSSIKDKIYCIDMYPDLYFEKEKSEYFHILAVKFIEEEWPIEFLNLTKHMIS